MQRAVSESRSGSVDSPPVSRDPRIRARTAFNTVSGHSSTPTRGEQEKEDASKVSTPQIAHTNVQKSKWSQGEASALENALLAFVASVVDSNFAKRNRDFMQTKAKAARAKYELHQRCYTQFPVVVEQALEEHKKIDSDFEATQQEARKYSEAEVGATSDLVRQLHELVAKNDENSRAQAAQLHDLRQDLERLRSQATTNADAKKVAGKLADLADENEALWKRVDSLHDKVPAVRQENEALRKSVYSLQDRVKTLEQESRDFVDMRRRESENSARMADNLRQDVAEAKVQIQSLSAGLKLLEQGSDSLESLKKSATLKLTTIQTRLEDAEDKIASLQKDITDDKHETETLRSQLSDHTGSLEKVERSIRSVDDESTVLKDKFSSLQRTGTGFADRIRALEHCMDSQTRDWNSLRSDVSALKSEVPASVVHDLKEVRTHIQELSNKVEQSTTESARANNARDELFTAEIERINHELKDGVDRIQHELTEVEKAANARSSTPLLSSEDRHKLNGLLDLKPKLRELEANLGKLQKGLEKHTHMIQWQNHRFDNLTTESLVRQMIGFLSPVLPSLEEGLAKVEAEIVQIRGKLDESITKGETLPAELGRRIQALEEGLTSATTELRSKLENLSYDIGTNCDVIEADYNTLKDSHDQFRRHDATYRATTDKKLSDVEAEVDALRRQFRKDSSPTSSPRNRARLVSGIGSRAHASRARQKSSATERPKCDEIDPPQEPSGSGEVAMDSEELNADEMGREASILLERFQKPPERSTGDMQTSKIVTLNIGAGLQRRGKRRRVDSPEIDDSDTVLVQQQSSPPVARRTTKPNDT